MGLRSNVSHYEEQIAYWRQRERELEAELLSVRTVLVSLCNFVEMRHLLPQIPLVYTDEKIIDEIRLCQSQSQACQLIAQMRGGQITVRHATDLIYRSGRWTGKKPGIRAAVSRYLSKGPEWERIQRGHYRLKNFSAAPQFPQD